MLQILAIEDDSKIVKLYESLFAKIGANLFLATSEQEMTRILNDEQIDVVLMDYHIEGFGYADEAGEKKHTGLTLAKLIASNSDWQHIPVVLVTADKSQQEFEKAKNSGIAGVVFKPFESLLDLPQQLEEIIKRWRKEHPKKI